MIHRAPPPAPSGAAPTLAPLAILVALVAGAGCVEPTCVCQYPDGVCPVADGDGTDTDRGEPDVPESADPDPTDTADPETDTSDRMAGAAIFRVAGDHFEINQAGTGWRPFFAVGVNLAVGTPGRWPSEMDHEREQFDRWMRQIADMNCNVIRTYTLHFPVFYEAFRAYNEAHPEKPVYLVQGIWLDEIEHGDYMTDTTAQIEEETRTVIDALHGNADVPLRFGKSFGTYRTDVTPWLMAWLPGHEMMGHQVQLSNERWVAFTSYDGYYISATDRKPIEAWVARNLDLTVAYEMTVYGQQRPVAWSNWPALDMIHHPTETPNFDQDTVDADLSHFQTSPGFTAGIYASYHIYPFNPEFILYDPGYVQVRDSTGRYNSYLGYLLDLKSRLTDVPLFVTEFGLPSSLGVAHVGDRSWNHGGYSEVQQAEGVVELFRTLREANVAGVVLFELLDEWFKRTWMTNTTTIPLDRGRLWFDVTNPEENFGAIAYYPVPGVSLTIDGDPSDWGALGQRIASQAATPLAGAAEGGEPDRTLTALSVHSDHAFVFLRVDTASAAPLDLSRTVFLVGISSVGGETGGRRIPDVDVLVSPANGFESLLVIDGANGVYELRTDARYDPTPKLNGEPRANSTPGIPTSNDDGRFVLARYIVNNDAQYVAGGLILPEKKYFAPGQLIRGDSRVNTLAHILPFSGTGGFEIRIPWHSLWVSDPSSRQVLSDSLSTNDFDSTTTDGFRFVLIAARREGGSPRLVDALPRGPSRQSPVDETRIPSYLWERWESAPETGERLKPLYFAIRDAYGAAQ